jgi:chromosome segregation ATPase
MCDYHTQRADELEEHVRTSLAGVDGSALPAFAGNEEQVMAEWQEKAERLGNRVRALDRRLDDQFAAAAKGRITREQLQKLSINTAAQRLELEEELEDVQQRILEQASASERLRGRQKALASLLDGWGALGMPEKQSLLREVIDRVVVHDDGTKVVMRP